MSLKPADVPGRLRAACAAVLTGRQGGSRRGTVALMVALLFIPIAGVAALAIDAGRGYMVRSRLSASIDAAALAAGRVLETTNAVSDGKAYFHANIPSGYLGATILEPVVTVGADLQTVTVKADAQVPTVFMRVLGVNTLNVHVENQARRKNTGLELALVLDITGSMDTKVNNVSRIQSLRDAATSLVNIIFGSQETVDNLWVSVVPYSAMVNLGASHTSWLMSTARPDSAYGDYTWRGCVEARTKPYFTTDYDQDDTPPSVAPFQKFLYPSTLKSTTDSDNSWPPAKKADRDDGDHTTGNDKVGPNLGCGFPVMSLINSKTTVLNKIAGLQATYRGGTMANLGLQAGWFTLSPRWRGLWAKDGTPSDMPYDYYHKNMQKAVVLVTDGDNQWFDYDKPPVGDYTAYGRLSEKRLGTDKNTDANTEINKRMSNLCQKMKDSGIIMYTITIGQTVAATQTLYRNCASKPSYYWDSPTADQLSSIFGQIGAQLSNLRLEK